MVIKFSGAEGGSGSHMENGKAAILLFKTINDFKGEDGVDSKSVNVML